MARPCKCRNIRSFPDHWVFHADNGEDEGEIVMSIDEYETIRLIDLEGMTQEECASGMDVARTTVTSIYDSARRKLARHLTEGTKLRISGGAYRISPDEILDVEEKGADIMRIAMTYEDGMVGQHFGHTEEFKLYDVEDGKVTGEQIVSTNGQGHGMLAVVLKEIQADLLICGGIGMGARMALEEAGISLIPGVEGNADEVIKAYLDGSLAFDPDAACSHHEHEEDHGCGEHKCN